MKQELPVGSGIFYEKIDNEFKPCFMNAVNGQKSSYISFEWLNHMQKFFIKDQKIFYIQSAMNGPEKKIGKYFLDGFVVYAGKRIGLDFR